MSWSLFWGLVVFSAVSAFTPGPNNLIALASGASRGFRKTIPHVAGVALGFAVMVSLVGAGLGALFETFPPLYRILRYVAFAYLLYLAWHIARSDGMASNASDSREVTLLGSAAFQWVNPKAWFAAITVISSFTDPDHFALSVLLAGAVNVILACCAVSSWAAFGTVVRRALASPLKLRVFNVSMAALLVLSVLPSLLH